MTVMGEILELLANNGFEVEYRFNQTQKIRRFIIRKSYWDKTFEDSWMIDNVEYEMIVSKHLFTREADLHMRKVDEAIIQYRLIQEALS
jgi:hypothetical protein